MSPTRADSTPQTQRWHWQWMTSLFAVVLVAACGEEVPEADGGVRDLCGNGVREGAEQCDGNDWAARSCEQLSPAFSGGTLRCDRLTCTFESQDCVVAVPSHCGDGVVEGDEECEPDLAMERPSCEELGVDDGCPGLCNPQTCRWVSKYSVNPAPFIGCGDGIVTHFPSAEECDGDDFDGLTCMHLKTANGYFSGGTLSCTDNCQLDTLNCIGPNGERCGNGIREPGESCDGNDIGGASCNLLGGQVGYYACRPDCRLDRSNCVALCNNRFQLGLCF